jgi:hypothetical protein
MSKHCLKGIMMGYPESGRVSLSALRLPIGLLGIEIPGSSTKKDAFEIALGNALVWNQTRCALWASPKSPTMK